MAVTAHKFDVRATCSPGDFHLKHSLVMKYPFGDAFFVFDWLFLLRKQQSIKDFSRILRLIYKIMTSRKPGQEESSDRWLCSVRPRFYLTKLFKAVFL